MGMPQEAAEMEVKQNEQHANSKNRYRGCEP